MSLEHKIELGPEEILFFVVRSYVLTFWWRYFVGFLLVAVAAFFSVWLFSRGVWGEAVFVLLSILGVYVLLFTHYMFRSNRLILTNERVIDVTRSSWFKETVTSLSFYDLGDCQVKKRGVWQRIFNYGSLYLHTKDARLQVEVPRVHRPHQLLATITEHMNSYLVARDVRRRLATVEQFEALLPSLSETELVALRKKINDQLALLD